MEAPDLLRQRSRETAIEVLSLLDEISRLSARAWRAAALDDPGVLAEILDRRQPLFAEAARQVHALAVLCRESSGVEAAEIAPVLSRVRMAARRVEEENEALAAYVAHLRDAVTDTIAHANTASLAAAAYRPGLRLPRLDLVH